ncbi:MAG: hypothetical protein EOO37_02255 [Cytophagaceae bacterium]|nr:MAG: hypothetical protein EOO37_02255 [Cytophagaceae bacterium]
MKRIFGLFMVLSTCGSVAYAQSTMPAMGANTPKGEVAKTDASVNQTSGMDKSNASKSTGKRTDKAKAKKGKPMMAPQ